MAAAAGMDNKLTTEQAINELMKSEEGKKLAYECYYEWDVIAACQRFQASEEWQATLSILSTLSFPGSKALDLGAGNGIASFALRKLDFSVTAVEPDPSELVGFGALKKMIQTASLPIYPVCAIGERLPFKNNEFALVYLRQVLHHARDLNSMLNEVARVLQPGGFLIAAREHVVDDEASFEEFLKKHPINFYTGQEGAFRLEDYKLAIKQSGLQLKKVLGPWDSVINHYPCSTNEFRQRMRVNLQKQLGKLGGNVVEVPGFEKLYRFLLSSRDKVPGRMYSFIAAASNK